MLNVFVHYIILPTIPPAHPLPYSLACQHQISCLRQPNGRGSCIPMGACFQAFRLSVHHFCFNATLLGGGNRRNGFFVVFHQVAIAYGFETCGFMACSGNCYMPARIFWLPPPFIGYFLCLFMLFGHGCAAVHCGSGRSLWLYSCLCHVHVNSQFVIDSIIQSPYIRHTENHCKNTKNIVNE